MRQALVEHGWEQVAEDGVPFFKREYPRVNETLGGQEWRKIVMGFSHVKEGSELPPGQMISMAGNDTEATVQIAGDSENRSDLTKAFLLDRYLRSQGFEEMDESLLTDWLTLKGELGAPERESREFYEQDPRAAELRELCLEAIEEYQKVIISEGTEGPAIEALLDLNQRMEELGIKPDMHAGRKAVELVDPVSVAEWAAGQLRNLLTKGYGFSDRVRALLQEHDLLGGEGDGTMAIDTKASPEAGDAANLVQILDRLAQKLGRDD